MEHFQVSDVTVLIPGNFVDSILVVELVQFLDAGFHDRIHVSIGSQVQLHIHVYTYTQSHLDPGIHDCIHVIVGSFLSEECDN